ncbi:MAG: hypothetical protein ACYC91_19485 [Solirubrobacteraceae bacterium]
MVHALEHESGMLALAGSSDMRFVIEHAAEGQPAATYSYGRAEPPSTRRDPGGER